MHDRVVALEADLARLRAERDALAEAVDRAHRYRWAVDCSPVGIMCVSGATGQYVFVNDAFAELLGYTRQELESIDPYKIWIDATHPDSFEAERQLMERMAKGEIDRYQYDKRMISRKREPFWVDVEVIASRDEQGRLDWITGYFTEMQQQRATALDREQLEEQLRQAHKLGAIGKLAGGIAHDFNNRLVIIMGHGELLRRAVPPDGPLASHAEMILSSAKRAAELTRQLLAYSRRQVLKPETFDISQMVERVHRLLTSVLGDRIELFTKLDATRLILADPGQIEQVILNLALNARDAMPTGGKLTLETRDVTLECGEHAALEPGSYVALIVSDTGSGITGDVLPHIFEPFFTTKDIGQGSGLGLSMVEGIVQQSGGATIVETRVGQGTKFTIYLPQGAAASAEPIPADESVAPESGTFETVLVCDDDDEVRRLVVGVLGLRAYRLLQASNGRHALEIVGDHPGTIHLLVTDVAMPHMGGIELATELRKRHPHLRVLYVSGHTEYADLLSTPLGPDTHFLPKPFLPGDLTRAVTAILERQPISSGRA